MRMKSIHWHWNPTGITIVFYDPNGCDWRTLYIERSTTPRGTRLWTMPPGLLHSTRGMCALLRSYHGDLMARAYAGAAPQ